MEGWKFGGDIVEVELWRLNCDCGIVEVELRWWN